MGDNRSVIDMTVDITISALQGGENSGYVINNADTVTDFMQKVHDKLDELLSDDLGSAESEF